MQNQVANSYVDRLKNIIFILVEPQHALNVGMAIRAMMNTGLTRLRVVRPREWDPFIISAAAHRSEAFQERIEFFDDLDEALHDVNLVISTSNRRRELSPEILPPDELAPIIFEHARVGTPAILFGREDWGLPNEVVYRSHYQLYIPTDPSYASLNLAQAVLLTGYELRRFALHPRADLPTVQVDPKDPPASEGEFRAGVTMILEALGRAGFFKPGQEPAKRMKIDRLLRRTKPTRSEAALLRAMGHVLYRELACSRFAEKWERQKQGKRPNRGHTHADTDENHGR
ncbi:MAG TPA: RNA methyltransferase [Anaerolineae bacterium]|nr:RNA methyltransferase [Anaerolineae bacterium]